MIPLIRTRVKRPGMGGFGDAGTTQRYRENNSCCCPIFLVGAAHDDGKRIVQQRSLQRL
jgi:hypothetical protein